jgi:hypothetical protein
MKHKKKTALLALTGVMALSNGLDLGRRYFDMPTDQEVKVLTKVQADSPDEKNKSVSDKQISVEEITKLAKEAGDKYRISPSLILAVIKSESDFQPEEVSYKGAVGLMQIIPKYTEYTAEELKDPRINIFTGAKILRDNLEQFKSVKRALEAYNAGGTRVYDDSVPESTHAYVRRTMRNYVTFLMKEHVAGGYEAAYKRVLRDSSMILVGFGSIPGMLRDNHSTIFGSMAALNLRDTVSQQFVSSIMEINSLSSQNLTIAIGIGACVSIYLYHDRLVKPLMKPFDRTGVQCAAQTA